MLSWSNALHLLRECGLDESRIAHSVGVSKAAFELACAIKRKNPDAPCNPEKVRIGALLHDIGRSRPGDHELNSVAVLRERGLDDLAGIVMHGTLYEASILRNQPNREYLPASLENKIVAWADTRFRLSPVTIEERIAEVEKRRAGEEEKIAALRMARERYMALERELMGLR